MRFQEFQAKNIYEDIERYLKVPSNSIVLDYGCGLGGYTEYFKTKYKKVIGIDFMVNRPQGDYISANLIDYVAKEPVDFIFCASTIEHIKEQKKLLLAIASNLKKGGALYLSFPPFYGIIGGHKTKPFHYFPEKMAIWIAKKLGKVKPEVTGYDNMYGTFGLHKTRIKDIERLLNQTGFKIIKKKDRYFPLPIFHVEFYCTKCCEVCYI
jgi:2-polyprenyl-3-methyl-5-hydroxy-6-metoxy-1,4-benzoquinol methylase